MFITPFQQSSAAAQLPPPCVSWAHCQAGMPREAQLMFVLLHRWAHPRLPWPLLESLGWGCCRVELNHDVPQLSLFSTIPLQCRQLGCCCLSPLDTGTRVTSAALNPFAADTKTLSTFLKGRLRNQQHQQDKDVPQLSESHIKNVKKKKSTTV